MSIDMYQENILDHYDNPRNFGHLKKPQVKSHDTNPLCGDMFDMEFIFKDGKVDDIKFSGHGCAISTASASMLTEKIKGMKIEDVKKLEKQDILDLLGIEVSYARIKCALLSLKVMKLGVYDYLNKTTKTMPGTKKENNSVGKLTKRE
jgi:nitrogen fixation protein NifU and related proteins